MECLALPGFAFQKNIPLMPLDGFTRQKQLQAHFCSTEAPVPERVKNKVARVFLQAGTVVLHSQPHMRSRLQ